MTQNKCPYNKCNGSGLIPFKRKDGSISPFCKVFCDCHSTYGADVHDSVPVDTEGRRPGVGSQRLPRQIPRGRMHLYTDDFDFPMSYSIYRSLCQEHGWADPGTDRPPETSKPQVIQHIVRHSNMGQKEFDQLEQTSRGVKYLRGKIAELETKKKPQLIKSKSKGVKIE